MIPSSNRSTATASASPVVTARELAGELTKHAQTNEAERRLPGELIELLRKSGLIGLLVPRKLGGLGASIPEAIDAWQELVRADASTGWVMVVYSANVGIAAAHCTPEARSVLFPGLEIPIIAGMLAPMGKAVSTGNGYRGSGHFGFGSGIADANWTWSGMLVMEEGKPRTLPNGQPEVRVFLIPQREVQILDNWFVMGLKGTGSFDYLIADKYVAESFTFDRSTILPVEGGAIGHIGIIGMGCVGHSSIPLGIMQRALEEVAKIAKVKKRPGYSSVLANDPVFRHEFALKEALYQSACTQVRTVFGNAERKILDGHPLDPIDRQRFRQLVVWVHRVGEEVVLFCYRWAGTNALREPSDLGRCVRDMLAATQHMYVDPIGLVESGGTIIESYAGQDITAI